MRLGRVFSAVLVAVGSSLLAAPYAHAALFPATNTFVSGTADYGSAGNAYYHIDYAVFAPGDFLFDHPTGPATGWVYAYQVRNDATASKSLKLLTVGILDPIVSPTDPDYMDGIAPARSNSLDPTVYTPGAPGSMVWHYNDTAITGSTLDPGEMSAILYFTSPYSPSTAYVSAGPVSGSPPAPQLLPSPIPEPGTIGLLVGCAALMVLRRRL